jgi:hypothetical protein
LKARRLLFFAHSGSINIRPGSRSPNYQNLDPDPLILRTWELGRSTHTTPPPDDTGSSHASALVADEKENPKLQIRSSFSLSLCVCDEDLVLEIMLG